MKQQLIFVLIFLATIISGCATKPTHIIVAPQVFNETPTTYFNKQASVTVHDQRTSKAIIKILKSGEAATLYSASEPLDATIKTSLISAFKKQGLNITSYAENKIDVFINIADITVTQELVKYSAKNQIQIIVKLNNGDQTITNAFKSSGSSNGPLNADIAVLERDFNQQLGNVIVEIISNNDFQESVL